ncbi:hypothetical protein [Nocardioides sp.]|uniref:hypothetical protein n=1 Tax=Nocardioides sp. TaxID=35761 RepID=UPI0039E3BB7F
MSPSDRAREAAISAAAWCHGLRRAVHPETRFRARWTMKSELRRRRKARKAEVKAALREYRARRDQEALPEVGR